MQIEMGMNFKRRIELLREHIATFSYTFKQISCQYKSVQEGAIWDYRDFRYLAISPSIKTIEIIANKKQIY